ncbi:MAG: metallophosphoesterase family protein [Spirochaetales bacterium]|jgi:predicted phosphodiesterase|nr:metallophosphoesterase family protein [Spirochaetales bacterium]
MRIAILADIHANYQALQAVLADIDTQNIDDIICLGDNIGYGPQPDEVVRALMTRNIFSITGNHELGLHDKRYYKRLNFTPQDSLDLTRDLLSEETLAWSIALPTHVLRHGARFVHGSPPDSPTQYIVNPTDKKMKRLLASYPEQLCFYGHTHNMEMFICEEDKSTIIHKAHLNANTYTFVDQSRYLITPGSVGQPRDWLNRKAKYGIWQIPENTIEIRALSYDVQTTIALLNKSKFHSSNAARLGG